MPGDLFIKETLMISYILKSKKQIQLIFLLDTNTISIAFINESMARTVCKILKNLFLELAKPKPLQKFDS